MAQVRELGFDRGTHVTWTRRFGEQVDRKRTHRFAVEARKTPWTDTEIEFACDITQADDRTVRVCLDHSLLELFPPGGCAGRIGGELRMIIGTGLRGARRFGGLPFQRTRHLSGAQFAERQHLRVQPDAHR